MNFAAGRKICWCVKVCAFDCGCSIISVQRVWLAELLWDRTAHHKKTKGGVSLVLTHPFRLQRRYFRENDLVPAEEMHSFGF